MAGVWKVSIRWELCVLGVYGCKYQMSQVAMNEGWETDVVQRMNEGLLVTNGTLFIRNEEVHRRAGIER